MSKQSKSRESVQEAPLTGPLRALIANSGKSIFALSRSTGIGYATLSDFAAGRSDIRLCNADKLATYLGLELRAIEAAPLASRKAKRSKGPKKEAKKQR